MPTLQNGVLRNRPRINVVRGYTGNEPGNITLSAPLNVAITNAGGAANTIYSGQALILEAAGTFNLSGAADPSSAVYFAYHDSTDTDVDSCGKLLGFSSLGTFEIESAWVDTANLAVGDGLQTTANGGLAKGTTATKIVGYVTEIRDLGVGGHTALGTTGVQRGGVAGTIPEDSTAPAWGTTGVASGGTIDNVITGWTVNSLTAKLTDGEGNVVETTAVAFANDNNNSVTALKTAIDTAVADSQALDASIIAVTRSGGTITITTHPGAQHNVALTLHDVAAATNAVNTPAGTDGASPVSASTMNIVKFVVAAR